VTFIVRNRSLAAAAAVVLVAGVTAVHASAQDPTAPPGRGRAGAPTQPGAPDGQARGRGRATPPQPQQKQGVEYFVGSWTFSWTGRESPITQGPRQGTVTFTRKGTTPALAFQTEGKWDDSGAAYKESGTAEWDEAKKAMTFTETLANGTRVTGVGDWTSPLSIRYESQPVKIGSEQVRIRRNYAILAPHAFSITEEISLDGGPFQRLGNAVFSKQP
jgi:hypothetical protein